MSRVALDGSAPRPQAQFGELGARVDEPMTMGQNNSAGARLTPDVALAALEQFERERAEACMAELKQVLERHGCVLEPYLEISPRGSVQDVRCVAIRRPRGL